MTAHPQLPLDLGFRPALGRDDFLVAPPNRDAVAWIDAWPAWPSPALVLAGPPGAGKTHLAAVWQGRSGAAAVAGDRLSLDRLEALLGTGSALVVEAADAAPEEALLHLHNGMAERRGSLLLTAAAVPARWGTRLPDLASRLAALPVAVLASPDDALIRAVLVKLFADRRVKVPAAVIEFLAVRMERSFAAARRLAAAIDAESMARQRPVTIGLARAVLDGIEAGRAGPANPAA